MQILHFCRGFSPTSQTFIYDYVRELERQGLNNHVVTLQRLNEESRPFPKVDVLNTPSRWNPRRLWYFGRHLLAGDGLQISKRISKWPQIRGQLAQVVQRIEPDVIHAHFGPAGVIIGTVAEAAEIPLIVTFYGYDVSSLPEEVLWEEQYATLWSQIDAATVLSEEMRQTTSQLGCPGDKLNIVHLSRDLEQFSFNPPTPPIRSVLFVGRLVPKKAPIDAIQAVQRANRQGADLRLNMVGGGPLREEAHQYVQKNDLLGEVTLHGQLPNTKVAKQMQAADAFLLPSKTAPDGDREGTPTVLVEAQATGLPCVTTRHAGIPEMIPDANHDLLVPEGDVEALADALSTLSESSVYDLKQIAERGREKVEQDFSLSGEVGKLTRLYSSY